MADTPIVNRLSSQSIRELAALIKDSKIAMLVTRHPGGILRSRPMATQQVDFDGDLWFLTMDDSLKAEEIRAEPHVNVSYSEKDRWISIAGTAELVQDRQNLKKLWKDEYQVWVPGGVDDPHLTLLKITIVEAEYWSSTEHKMVRLEGCGS